MRQSPYGEEAAVIGQIVAEPAGRVLLANPFGGKRIVDMLMGEILPRIC
jgi:hydrogenase expression/formation protein HypE